MATSEVPERLRDQLKSSGQEHLLRWWRELAPPEQRSLLAQIESLDLDEMGRILDETVDPEAALRLAQRAEPLRAVRLADGNAPAVPCEEAAAQGEHVLRDGKVAALLVAGGQGTRLGFPHPKGMYPIGPVTERSLFKIHAEKLLATGRRYGREIPYYVMTSDATHEATVEFFEKEKFFGLGRGDVMFFRQGSMPAVDARTRRLLLADKGRLFTSPNGHGGVLEALARSGSLEDMRRRGIEWIFYHQVDNPLVPVCDPEFVGHSVREQAEVSVKVVAKEAPDEALGNVINVDGRLHIIEYSEFGDFPEELRAKWQTDGSPLFWAGSIAVHVFQRSFLERLTAGDTDLPYHKALKKVAYLNDAGERVEPDEENAFKFERFIFDVLPRAARWVVVEVDRADEYDPLKNESGQHSPEAVKASLTRLYSHWLERAGVAVPAADNPEIEISPLYALDAAELERKVDSNLKIDGPLILA